MPFLGTRPITGAAKPPTAVLAISPQYAVVGSVITLDARGSTDPYGANLTYTFGVVTAPIGSQARLAPFTEIGGEPGYVSFVPDRAGVYVFRVAVSNGSYSSSVDAEVDLRAILVPYARGVVPDGKFIWSYLRDAWTQVEGREFFETLWSAFIQIAGGELLKLYQVDYNKSIEDIQSLFQRRWLAYEPRLELSAADLSMYLGYTMAGPYAVPGSGTVNIELAGNEQLLTMAPGRLIIVNGQGYTITRVSADRTQRVPVAVIGLDRDVGGTTGLPWRIPNTLLSSSQDFEALGVSAGDALVVSVGTSSVSTVFRLNVVGVSGKRLGFVVTDEPTESGVVPAVPDSFYLQLASYLGVKTVTQTAGGELVFSDTALKILQYLQSSVFRSAFWNQKIAGEMQLSVAGMSFVVHEVAVVRNSTIPVDESLRSVPSLQEDILFPEIREYDSGLVQVRHGEEFPIERRPVALREGAHYLVDGQTDVLHIVFRTGTNVIQADGVDFLDSGYRAGDTFVIEHPAALGLSGAYRILQVPSNSTLVLDRAVPLFATSDYAQATVRITRSRSGQFLRFVPGLYSAKNPAPDRFWGELSFFDNNATIENNFGVLVGLRRQDFVDIESSVEYRQAVTGVMYALSKGSTLDKIRLGAQVLLGLPFAEHRGIIRSIEPTARTDFYTGEATHGRIVVEDVNGTGEGTGLFRFYFYPLDSVSTLAGLETNPVTGAAYAVGDVVERFVPLCKGVEISDYVSAPEVMPSLQSLLQRYHSLRLRANDLIFGQQGLSAVSEFLRRITPSYVAWYLTMLTEVRDSVPVTDFVSGRERTGQRNPPIADNVALGLPFPLQYDQRLVSYDGTSFYDGIFTLRRGGEDLATGPGLSVPSGGLLDPRANETFEAPLVEAGDKLIIKNGFDAGTYTVSGATDTTLTVSDGPAEGFQEATGLRYAVVREVKPRLLTCTATYATSSATVSVPDSHLRTRGVMPGDVIVLDTAGTPQRRLITAVEEATPGSGVWDQLTVTPNPSTNGTGVDAAIFRLAFFRSPSAETYSITSDGSNTLTAFGGELYALCDVGDELLLHERDDQLRVTILDPVTKYVTPAPAAGTYSVKLCKAGFSSTALRFDGLAGHVPYDEVVATLVGRNTTVANAAANGVVTFPGAGFFSPTTKPGDQIIFTSGTNASTDIGYGPGVFIIKSATSDSVTTTTALTAENGINFKLVRRVYRA